MFKAYANRTRSLARCHHRALQELVDDPDLARWPGKIETDRFGRTVMSTPPAFGHVSYAGKIIRWLNELLPDGRALPETPVLTAGGIKVHKPGPRC